jgi:RNA polymerase sigma factor (sigma-70 family)
MVFRLAQKISWRYKLDLSECVGLGNFTLVERFDKFDPERGKFFTYMRKIVAYRMLRDQFDYYSRARDYDAAIDDVAQEYQEIDLQGKYAELHAALRQLNKEESEIIHLLFFTPMRYSEESVAKCLGRTVRGLKESKAAILAKLRDIMGFRDYFPEKQYAIIK